MSTCQYPEDPREVPCGEPAPFSIRWPGADPVHPDPELDNREACAAHLAAMVRLADAPEPGRTVHVTVGGAA